MSYLYLEITQDKYALPTKVATSPNELARLTGLKVSSIYNAVSQADRGYFPFPRFIRVAIDDCEVDE